MLPHIEFDAAALELRLLDQRILPSRREYIICKNGRDAARAITEMVVRGAPAIGVTAAYGCVLALNQALCTTSWNETLAKELQILRTSRPTAINLAWAIDRMEKIAAGIDNGKQLLESWILEARKIQAEDIAICQQIGANGADLIANGDTVLTHCNAGALATAGHGTALGVIRSAIAQGKKVKVIADETRPFLQGARLTAYELAEDGIDITVACDNACAHLISEGKVQTVITGADRIAANGDTANKIGTQGVAIIAKYYNIPFYIAAPLSTIDLQTPEGKDIPIETRSGREVLEFNGTTVAPVGVNAYNFAFDVTPAELIAGIITEKGILRPPYPAAIAALFD